jgi:hypothetical protein
MIGGAIGIHLIRTIFKFSHLLTKTVQYPSNIPHTTVKWSRTVLAIKSIALMITLNSRLKLEIAHFLIQAHYFKLMGIAR